MRPDDYETFATLLKANSGLALTADKQYLLESRLMPVARARGLADLAALAAVVRTGRDRATLDAVTEAMTTNETFFFRDTRPFDQFRDLVLPALLKDRAASRSIRIWSAAASSGQEAYSLAMILQDKAAQLAGWRIEIVGTDLSSEMIERARQGLYSQFEVQRGLAITQLVKNFTKDGDRWRIKDELRRVVQFRTWNLLDDPRPLGKFDVVFLRNVLIYFDAPTKGKVLDSIARQMPEDGILYLGGAETVLGISNAFAPYPGERGMYRPTGASGTAASGLRLAG